MLDSHQEASASTRPSRIMASLPEDSDLPPPSFDTWHIITPTHTEPPSYDGPVQPQQSSRTTHTYKLNPKPHTEVTLVLNTSFSPSPTNVALFFSPGVVGGEVKLKLEKSISIRQLTVYVQGQSILKGVRNWEPIPGEKGQKGVFWETTSPNLLYSSSNGATASSTSVDIGAGTHTFPFSITLPSTYSKAKPQGAVSWVKGLFGVGGTQTAPEIEELPLPGTTLRSELRDRSLPRVTQYSVWVSIETGPYSDDYKFSKQVVILPARVSSRGSDTKTPPQSDDASGSGSGSKSKHGDFMPIG